MVQIQRFRPEMVLSGRCTLVRVVKATGTVVPSGRPDAGAHYFDVGFPQLISGETAARSLVPGFSGGTLTECPISGEVRPPKRLLWEFPHLLPFRRRLFRRLPVNSYVEWCHPHSE